MAARKMLVTTGVRAYNWVANLIGDGSYRRRLMVADGLGVFRDFVAAHLFKNAKSSYEFFNSMSREITMRIKAGQGAYSVMAVALASEEKVTATLGGRDQWINLLLDLLPKFRPALGEAFSAAIVGQATEEELFNVVLNDYLKVDHVAKRLMANPQGYDWHRINTFRTTKFAIILASLPQAKAENLVFDFNAEVNKIYENTPMGGCMAVDTFEDLYFYLQRVVKEAKFWGFRGEFKE